MMDEEFVIKLVEIVLKSDFVKIGIFVLVIVLMVFVGLISVFLIVRFKYKFEEWKEFKKVKFDLYREVIELVNFYLLVLIKYFVVKRLCNENIFLDVFFVFYEVEV